MIFDTNIRDLKFEDFFDIVLKSVNYGYLKTKIVWSGEQPRGVQDICDEVKRVLMEALNAAPETILQQMVKGEDIEDAEWSVDFLHSVKQQLIDEHLNAWKMVRVIFESGYITVKVKRIIILHIKYERI